LNQVTNDPHDLLGGPGRDVGGVFVTKYAPRAGALVPFQADRTAIVSRWIIGAWSPSLGASPPRKIADVPQLDRAVRGT